MCRQPLPPWQLAMDERCSTLTVHGAGTLAPYLFCPGCTDDIIGLIRWRRIERARLTDGDRVNELPQLWLVTIDDSAPMTVSARNVVEASELAAALWSADVQAESRHIETLHVRRVERLAELADDEFWHCRCGKRYGRSNTICPACGTPRGQGSVPS
jgi:ribosomal protein L32